MPAGGQERHLPPGLWRVSEDGGGPTPLTDAAADGAIGHLGPRFLPDPRRVVFEALYADSSRIEVFSLDTGVRQLAIDGAIAGSAIIPAGYVAMSQPDGSVRAAPFDLAGSRRQVPIQGASSSARTPGAHSATSSTQAGTQATRLSPRVPGRSSATSMSGR